MLAQQASQSSQAVGPDGTACGDQTAYLSMVCLKTVVLPAAVLPSVAVSQKMRPTIDVCLPATSNHLGAGWVSNSKSVAPAPRTCSLPHLHIRMLDDQLKELLQTCMWCSSELSQNMFGYVQV